MADQVFNALSGFYNAVSGDRTYDAEDMCRPYHRLVSNGVFATAEGTPSNDLRVVSSGGMVVTVKAGEGLFGDKWFELPADQAITVPANTAILPRMDSVIVQIDKRLAGRVGSIVYRTGVASSNPVPPSISLDSDLVEYRLANITVAASAASLTASNIADMRGSAECPWVTSLIYQVDTSVLFAQWQAAYAEYYDSATESFDTYVAAQRSAWEDFLASLVDDLTVTPNVLSYRSRFVSSSEVTSVPISIASYDKTLDVLEVYINGLRAIENEDYTVDSNSANIILVAPILAGQTVDFVVLKSLVTGDLQSVSSLITALDAKLDAAIADTGWVELTPQNGAAHYNDANKMAYRRIGKQVFLRGCFKGVTSVGTTVASLPVGYRPSQPHTYTVTQVSGSLYGKATVMQVTAGGAIKVLTANGTLSSTQMCSIATTFLND